mmetsp:Transcript_654/g.1336  ORF Transcript_654/g.1336 Transcript_654/m.1336 type:complete len:114 (+) Transcript_654:133-474(+)
MFFATIPMGHSPQIIIASNLTSHHNWSLQTLMHFISQIQDSAIFILFCLPQRLTPPHMTSSLLGSPCRKNTSADHSTHYTMMLLCFYSQIPFHQCSPMNITIIAKESKLYILP